MTGGVLALGLAMGRMDPKDTAARDRIYARARELYQRFEKEFGTVLCFSLTQCDLATPEDQKKFKHLGLHKVLCSKFVRGMVKWVGEMIEGETRRSEGKTEEMRAFSF